MLLWDATMAHSIARSLALNPQQLVVHLCGSFHCEQRLGIVEMLQHYRPGTQQLAIVMRDELDCHVFVPHKHKGAGDFVVLTEAPAVTHVHAHGVGSQS